MIDGLFSRGLSPLTEAGRTYCSLAVDHAKDFASRVEISDRDGSLPVVNFLAMQNSGFMGAVIPEELGGGGLDSVHDLALCIERIARVDASTAIAVNMHFLVARSLVQAWRVTGEARLRDMLENIARHGTLHCEAGAEPGASVMHPLTTAKKLDGQWIINGLKIFATLSEIADYVHIPVRVKDERGFSTWMAMIPHGTPGMKILENWDGLGMRASGSHTIRFRKCVVPDWCLTRKGPWGAWDMELIDELVCGQMGLLGTYLGIAEAAYAHTIPKLRKNTRGPGHSWAAQYAGVQHGIGMMRIDLVMVRSILAQAAVQAEARLADIRCSVLFEGHRVMADFQCAKWLINRKTIDIVNQAMTLIGGSSYLRENPLARFYRDVRAGPFMQPFSPNEALEYIGRTALGIDPVSGEDAP